MAAWARQAARCGWLKASGLLGLSSRSGAARACCGVAPLPALLSGRRLPPWRLHVSVADCAQPSRAKGEACAPRSSLPVAVKQEAPETVSDLSTAKLYEDWDDVPPSSALEEISEEEAVKIIADPLLPPQSSTLRDYVDHSETLTKLVHLGVDLSQVEKRQKAGQLLLTLDFEKDITKILLFLKDVGIEDNQLGPFLTKNPYILGEDVEALESRKYMEKSQNDPKFVGYFDSSFSYVFKMLDGHSLEKQNRRSTAQPTRSIQKHEIKVAYLKSKKFGNAEITQMVSRAPYLLLFSVERLDNRLGFFKNELGLSVKKTKDLVIRFPRLLTGKLEPVKENLQVCQVEFGFQRNEVQQIAFKTPKILTASKKRLRQTFDYLHNIMGIPHNMLTRFPQVFNSKLLRIKERHMFLIFLGRAQYDPTQPSYISLEQLVSLPDEVFCTEIAKTSMQDFEKFLKTI